MYCKNCGNEIAEGSRFCSQCGSPVPETQAQPEAAAAAAPDEGSLQKAPAPPLKEEKSAEAEAPREPLFKEFSWNVEDYPVAKIEKTEDINFDWNADPHDIPDGPIYVAEQTAPADIPEAVKPEKAEAAVEKPAEPLSAADRIDKFYTFNKKNEEFQQLLNKEYEKVKNGNVIAHEMSQAEELADQRFRSRPEDSSMEAFLEREGIVKPYQPKEFESDVLQRIEAQEAQKEAKRLEEEARLAAIEEARITAEAEAKIAAETEARIAAEEAAQKRAEEEAARLAEIAKAKEAEEARAAEEARIRAEEEARIRAEQEERLRAETEARLRAEAEAKVKAAEEARLKAEADLRAAQEAAKIRAQQEARLAAEAEARFKENQEKQRLEALEAQKKLEAERRKIDAEANQAVAEEEVRKVIEQTTRMKDEEAAKIKAAVAAMREGIDLIKEDAHKKEIEEAHRATRNQIDEMAKARNDFFAELEKADAAQEEAPAEQAIDDISQLIDDAEEEKPVTGRETMLSDNSIENTRVVDKAAVMAGLSDATIIASKETTPAPASDEDFFNSLDAAAEAGRYQPEAAEEAQPIDFREESPKTENAESVDDLLMQFESVNDMAEEPAEAQPEEPFEMEHTIQAGSESFPIDQNTQLNETVVIPGKDTLQQAGASNDFDNYGNEEAADYINRQRQQSEAHNPEMDDFYGDGFYDDVDESQLSKKELKKRAKEQKRIEKERAKEAKILKKRDDAFDNVVSDDIDDDGENKGGKGRLVLKIILVILIVILAVEIVGMGIRFIAPQSKAAEFIDNQLNKVIHLITGDDVEYSVIAAQVRTEPMEDKTDLINAQMDKNAGGNIKTIVYSSDLGYDQDTYGKVSDLVLSQPMTQVEWGRDEDNYPVYYDEQVVGEIIAFESEKYNLMSKGNEAVLKRIKSDSKLYSETAALKNQKPAGDFEKLEIGEIRQAGSNFCVWVRETIGGVTTEKVYSMIPEKQFVLKLTTCYEV